MRVSRDYRVTIPYRIRKQLGMLPGTEVDIVVIDGLVYLVKTGDDDCPAVSITIRNDKERSHSER